MIPNIVKGRGITGALAYAMGEGNDDEKKEGVAYVADRAAGKAKGERRVLAEGEESRADILGGQNFGFEIDSAERVELARRMMEWNGKEENQASRGRKCEKDCLHASLSWEKGQEPTREEMAEAAKGFLKSIGMENAQAVFIAHNDTSHKHLHIVASRIDPLSGKTYSQEDDFAKGQAWSLQYERERGQTPQNEQRRNLHRIVDAIEARDGAALVDNLTARNPTFTARELDKALSYGTLTKEQRAEFRGQILADKNVIGLRDTPDAEVTRYTSRAVLAAEMGLLRSAQALDDDRSHGLRASRVDQTAAAFTLKPEQADALRHLTQASGFGVLWGEAGTGKSHTLNAARSAYEGEGRQVIGLAWTNDVVQQMRGDGFKNTNTIASELKGIEAGRTAWGKHTVLVVDEAAMIATDHLAQLAKAASQAGAKLILAGDDAQLGSIERGGMFETLRQRHGAAILEDVQRVKDLDQKAAFNTMHKGEFRGALETFDKAGGIHWSEKQNDALRGMAQRYTADIAADPEKRRFMFAFSNAEVGALNQYARAVEKQRGALGDDVSLKTAHGEAVFATGDRIQFSGNGYGKKAKNAGLTNGRVGTITALELVGEGKSPRVTVALDTAKGAAPQEVSFVVGENGKAGEFDRFKHGYAGTIYRGQGRTLDQAYVCHSSAWRSSAAYVALTRHRESVQIFAAHETVKDLDAMAAGMARKDNKRAASAYALDEATAARLELSEAAAPRKEASAAPTTAAPDRAARAGAATTATPTRSAAHGVGELGNAAASATAGAARALDGIAGLAGKAVETLADTFASLFGGGSSAPPPQKAEKPQPNPSPSAKVAQQSEAQRSTHRQELLRDYGREIPDEVERDAAIERDKTKGRERTRGE